MKRIFSALLIVFIASIAVIFWGASKSQTQNVANKANEKAYDLSLQAPLAERPPIKKPPPIIIDEPPFEWQRPKGPMPPPPPPKRNGPENCIEGTNSPATPRNRFNWERAMPSEHMELSLPEPTEGEITIEMTIDTYGTVIDVKARNSGIPKTYEEWFMREGYRTLFTPAVKNCEYVMSKHTQKMRFSLDGQVAK